MRKDYVCANMARAIHEMPLRRRDKLRSVPIWEGSGAQAGDHAGSPLRYNIESGKEGVINGQFNEFNNGGGFIEIQTPEKGI